MWRDSAPPRWRLVRLLAVISVAGCCGQGLPRDPETVLSASKAAETLASSIARAEEWRQQAKLRPSGACNTRDGSLCAPRTSVADDSALLLVTSPHTFDLRDIKQTGGLKVVTPVLDQLDCNTCTAFAVAAAAEIALALGAKKNATAWLSPQDLFFCTSLAPGTERTCRSSWLVEPALAALVGAPRWPVKPSCLPYAPRSSSPCRYQCRDTNPDIPTGRFVYSRLTSEVDMQQWIRMHGAVLSSMQVYPDLFKFLEAEPDGVYKGPGARAKAEESYGHAVLLAGYSNMGNYWLVRSSWGPKVGTDGYFKVAYGASGVADASHTWGLRFKPLKPVPAYTASQVSPAAKDGCYNYKAAGDDYFSTVADKFGVPLKKLVLDNLGERVKDPASPLGGTTLLVCGAANVGQTLPPSSQAEALLRIKAAVDPDNMLQTWWMRPGSKAGIYCSWRGIECDGSGNVVKVGLSTDTVGGSKLRGVLPDAEALLALPKLTQFSAWRQDLVGTLPDNYGKLTLLEVLLLHGNKLRGTLPASWAGMVSLKRLRLGGWTEDGQLIQGNLLAGSLPPSWGFMTSLDRLALDGNSLSGPLPAHWGALRLRMLTISNNELTGSLPDSWMPLMTGALDRLDVSNNLLNGTLPASWGASKSMQILNIENNKLSGTIPSSWAAMPGLVVFNARSNDLSGAIPSKWASKVLSQIYLYGNKLTGPLPVWPAPNLAIYRIGSYIGGKCNGNQLSGHIPTDLATRMPRLADLSLQCNQLSGTLPPQLGELSQLKALRVFGNKALQGTLPSSLAKLANLQVLDVSSTSISGTIPESYGGLKSLAVFEILDSRMSGCVPARMARIEYVVRFINTWKGSASNITGFCN